MEATVEIFVHVGCRSEREAQVLAEEIRREFPAWQVLIRHCEEDRARALGILVAPSFVVNGELVAVGVPGKAWLLRTLHTLPISQAPDASNGATPS